MFHLIGSPEPCVPSNVSSQLMCSDGAAQVSWAHSANAVSYDVRATTSGQILTCKSSSPNCTLSDLICGQEYEIHVAATDGTCVTNYSAPFRQGQGTGATFDVVSPTFSQFWPLYGLHCFSVKQQRCISKRLYTTLIL